MVYPHITQPEWLKLSRPCPFLLVCVLLLNILYSAVMLPLSTVLIWRLKWSASSFHIPRLSFHFFECHLYIIPLVFWHLLSTPPPQGNLLPFFFFFLIEPMWSFQKQYLLLISRIIFIIDSYVIYIILLFEHP